MRFTFEVPGKPVPQGSMRSLGRGRMVHTNQSGLLPWRHAVGVCAVQHRPPGWDNTGPMQVRATFWTPRPKNHYRADGSVKDRAGFYPVTRPDLDKLIRALLDALTDAQIWVDDSQAGHICAHKNYGPPSLWCAIEHLDERRP
jgi:crossover junction endodeoxyribonuclease RusA